MSYPQRKQKQNFFNIEFPQKLTNKKHFRTQRGEIEQFDLFHLDSNIIPEDRILGVADIPGAEPNTLMSQAVRNRLIAKNLREQRQSSQIKYSSKIQSDTEQNSRQNHHSNVMPSVTRNFKVQVPNDSIDQLVKDQQTPKKLINIGVQTSKHENQSERQNHKQIQLCAQKEHRYLSPLNSPSYSSGTSKKFRSYLPTQYQKSKEFLIALQRVKIFNPKIILPKSNIFQASYLQRYEQRTLK